MDTLKKVRMPGRSLFFNDRDYRRPQDSEALETERAPLSPDVQSQLGALLAALKAARQGDFSVRLPIEKNGVMYEIAETFNDLIGLNESMANEIGRVSKIVGEEGELTGRASLGGAAGSWATNVDSINALINSLAQPTNEVARVITAVASGDLSQKMELEVRGVSVKGEFLRIATTANTMVDQLNSFASEVTRIAREVGSEGQLGGQAHIPGVAGVWQELAGNVNMMAENLTNQVRNIAAVTTAVANGDLSRKITVEVKGEILELKNTINTMVDQLNSFASEVTRIAREVGTEGQLGGQAVVPGVAGAWQELTSNVNMMAANLTSQVRDIAEVITAVANGDLSRKITAEARGEILQMKNTINGMVENLNMVIGEINSVMALVGEGNLTRMIDVDAAGEFASMVDSINVTIESLQGIVTELTEAGINVGAVSQNMLSAGQDMNAMVTQMSSSAEQIAGGAKAQAEQIAGASKESEGVGETASDTLTRVEDMNRMSETAIAAAAAGNKALDETINNTDLMLQGSQESVTRIESLSKSSEQIQEIVDVIRDIATQTNILAINAAIEAVRAGKQGKGFAVVAEEVKTLSADSKVQAKNISTLVQSVQKETEGTVETIRTMAENVGLVKGSIEQTSKGFEDINSSIESTSRTAKEISDAATTQKKSIDAVSQSLDKMSGVAADTSIGATQSSDSAKRLSARMQELTATATTLADMSEKLQEIVGRFTLEGAASMRVEKPAAAKKPKSKARAAPAKSSNEKDQISEQTEVES